MEHTVWYIRWVPSVSCVLCNVPERLFLSCNIHRTKFSPLAVFGTSPITVFTCPRVHCVPHFVHYRVVQTFDRMVRQLRAPFAYCFSTIGTTSYPYVSHRFSLRSTLYVLRYATSQCERKPLRKSPKRNEKRKEKRKRESHAAQLKSLARHLPLKRKVHLHHRKE